MQEACPMYHNILVDFFFLFMSYVTCCNGTYEQFKSNDENSCTLKVKSTGRNMIKSLQGRTGAISADCHLKLTFIIFTNGSSFQQRNKTASFLT